MTNHATKAIATADRVVSLAEDGLRDLERTIAKWPAEFRAIIWLAVTDIAAKRLKAARDAMSTQKEPS
jgi:hypothetical protein